MDDHGSLQPVIASQNQLDTDMIQRGLSKLVFTPEVIGTRQTMIQDDLPEEQAVVDELLIEQICNIDIDASDSDSNTYDD